MPKKIISACLLGIKCRYDGKIKTDKLLVKIYKKGDIIPVCPEQLGGLPTPRNAAGIESGRGKDVLNGKSSVIDKNGKDISKQFILGAKEVLKIARLSKVKEFIGRSGSPSCGLGITYKATFKNGKFYNKKVRNDGVTVALGRYPIY